MPWLDASRPSSYDLHVCNDASNRLAVYGSLAPGEVNHHHLSELSGTWQTGTVRGRLVKRGWGDDLGFPALIPDPNGQAIEVQLLTSTDLQSNWNRLDEFEGGEYRRIVMPVTLPDGRQVKANIYVASDDES